MSDMIDIRNRVRELQAAHLPPLKWDDILTVKEGGFTPDEAMRVNEYLARFVAFPTNDKGENVCLGCQLPFYKDGLMSALLGGAPHRASWEWGLAHGECYCTKCGWPARAYHYDIGKTDTADAVIERMNVTLAVHPDGLILRDDDSTTNTSTNDQQGA